MGQEGRAWGGEVHPSRGRAPAEHGGRQGTVQPDPERSAREGARTRGEVRGAEAKES